MSPTYNMIRTAMLAKRPIAFFYQGLERIACAHVIGTKAGIEQMLVFQYDGQSASGLPAGGQWRCMPISGVSDVSIIHGGWRSDPRHTKAQTCVDSVDIEIWVGGDGMPYVRNA